MKKALLIAIFLSVVAVPVFCQQQCTVYYQVMPLLDDTTSYCGYTGNICYQCYDISNGDNCSSTSPCSPTPPKRPPQPPIYQTSMPPCQRPQVLSHDRTLQLRASAGHIL